MLNVRPGETKTVTRRDFGRGLAAILAAGVAPSVIASGLRRGLAARLAAMGGEGGISAKSYVQNGLMALWDGIENAGWGVHDNSSSTWIDLIGGNNISIAKGSFGKDHYKAPAYENCATFTPYAATGENRIQTIEIVIKPYGCNGQVFVSFSSKGSPSRWFGIRVNSTFNFAHGSNCSSVQTPLDIHTYSGTTDCNDEYRNFYFNSMFLDGQSKAMLASGMTWSAGAGSINTKATTFSASELYSVRLYKRELSADEIAANHAVDKARFNMP